MRKETVNVWEYLRNGDTTKAVVPVINEGDLLSVMDAGAYGFVMSSNYNCRLRPAEYWWTKEMIG